MKHSFLTMLFGVLAVISCEAQTPTNGETLSHYLFNDFRKGKVLLKSGTVTEEELNYNALTSEMVYNDHGKYLAIANFRDVDTVTIEGRQFIPGMKGFYEVLTHTQFPLYEEYTSVIKDPGAGIGYGMSSNTSAATPLKSLIQSGGAYNLKLPDGYETVSQHVFYIWKDARFRPVGSARQLTGLFPDKKAWINDWVKEKKTDFTKREDVLAIVTGMMN